MNFLIIGLLLGIGIGYFLPRKSSTVPGAVDLMDPEEQEEFSAAGHKAIGKRIERRKSKIVEKAKTEGQITNDGVEDMFCIGDSTAGSYLKQLVDEGRLERVGSGRGTHYTPTNES